MIHKMSLNILYKTVKVVHLISTLITNGSIDWHSRFFSHSQFSIYARVYTSFELLLHACWFNSQSSFHFFLVLTREVLVAKRVNAFQASIWKVIRPYRRMDGDLGSARSFVWYYVRYVEELSKREREKKKERDPYLMILKNLYRADREYASN
jgi:hypothetical protein